MEKELPELIDKFMETLQSFKNTIKYQKRVPSFYKKRYTRQLKELMKIYKHLKIELLKINNEEAKKILNEFNKLLDTISSENITSEEKIKIIEKFEIKAIDVDIKSLSEKESNNQSFINNLSETLGDEFKNELEGLRIVYGKHGDCTAFLLRKILEKALIRSLINSGYGDEKLRDNANRYIGLEKLLDVAASWKPDGTPLLLPNTVRSVKGIKFLGDVAAHNYHANVDMEQIKPQMPYILVALKELSRYLKKEMNRE
jgi:hypothetical protein